MKRKERELTLLQGLPTLILVATFVLIIVFAG